MFTRATIALCLFPFAAFAQQITCDDQSGQQALNICAYQEWQAADADLNAVYADVLATLQAADAEVGTHDGDTEEDRLRTAQGAWITFRDASCDLAGYSMRGGSAEALLINGCMRAMTEARIIELQGLM